VIAVEVARDAIRVSSAGAALPFGGGARAPGLKIRTASAESLFRGMAYLSQSDDAYRPRRLAELLACAIAMVCALALVAGPAVAAPGSPGVPQAPQLVYAEDFENGVGSTPILLTSYTGASGETYSADPQWLTACNGAILRFSSPNSDQAASGCAAASSYGGVRQLAYALGVQGGMATPASNHAVTAYTESPNPGVDRIQFETESTIPLATSGRFFTFSVDAAAFNCHAPHPLFKFYLVDGATQIPTFTTPINPCTDPGAQLVSAPAVGSVGAANARVGTYAGNRALLFNGPELGIRMRNGQGTASGNDAAFDRIRVLDVTPQLDKSFSPATVDVGQSATLTFTITNTTELAEKDGWSFTDNLPAGLVVTDPAASTTCSGGQVTAPAGGGSIAVSGNLDAGQASCTVTVHVTSAAAGTYANCPTNVSAIGIHAPACASVTFNAADLSIVKRARSAKVVPGTDETFELVVTNAGPSTARNVEVSDQLPGELSFVSASPECGEAAGTVTCTVASLDSGASQTFRVTGRIASSLDHCLQNTARVTADTPDPYAPNNETTVCAPIEGRTDLSISKTASDTELPVGGGQVTFTLVVRNDGPSDASGVKVTDPMAQGLTLVGADASQGVCSTTGNRLSCDLGRLRAGGSAQVLITATTWATAGAITNTATVSANQAEPDRSNNTDSAAVSVPPSPEPPAGPFDLRVTKTANDKRVSVGQPVRYRIVVANRGPAAAPDVELTDTLNAPVSVDSVKATAGSCSKRIPLRCSLGTIAPGGKVTITVVAKHKRAGCRQRNAVSATGAGADADPANNLDTVDVCATKVTLRLSKLADSATVTAGGLISYTIRITNPTKGVARNARTCDRLPAGLVYMRSTTKAKLRGGAWCWRARTIAPGASRTYRITVRALRGASGSKVNRATVSGNGQVKAARAKRAVQVRPTGAAGGGVTG
jgi:uncharacterized repeat protein (TIGR01451 family)